jgi:sugar phosphate isomerase/epimerase
MVITYRGASLPTSFASCSLMTSPSSNLTLPQKLRAIASAGFDGIELSTPDIISYGAELNGASPKEDDYETLCAVAANIKFLCASLGLKILMLQPFANLEGWKYDTQAGQRKDAFLRLRGWLRIAVAAGTDMLQVGSSDAEGIETDLDVSAKDLAEAAELARKMGVRICYENWCWASAAPGWKEVWEVVKSADKENLGLCLDTFQTAGGEWADPTVARGLREDDGQVTNEERQRNWRASLDDLSRTISANKIYLLQISDAYPMQPPIESETKEGMKPRSRWSHDFRPLPFDGGYLPIDDVLAAVLDTGFTGWLSVEVFDSKKTCETEEDMVAYAGKAIASLQRLVNQVAARGK